MNDYLSDSMAWSFVGLVVGFAIGKTELTIRTKLNLWRRHDHT